MTTQESRDPGSLSRLLEELAEVPRPDVPAAYAAGLRPGTRVGRFIIEREIGRGASAWSTRPWTRSWGAPWR